jgi:lysozyme
MKTKSEGIKLIKFFEGCRLSAYKCPAGIPTIGYGNTFYKDGKKVAIGDKITQQQAEELLADLLPKYEAIVNKNVKVPVNQNQFDALVSFTWNTGGSQTLFKMINDKKDINTIAQWLKTHYTTGGGKVLQGLINRRNAEAELFKK